jgi:hypothetical protein
MRYFNFRNINERYFSVDVYKGDVMEENQIDRFRNKYKTRKLAQKALTEQREADIQSGSRYKYIIVEHIKGVVDYLNETTNQ